MKNYESSFKVGNRCYGARGNDLGQIGGGSGYANVFDSGDYIVSTYSQLASAVSKAQPGEVVFIPGNLKINLTSEVRKKLWQPLFKPRAGVTIASDRGKDGSAGALIYSDEVNTARLFRFSGRDIRITGLRIGGPTTERIIAKHKRSRCIETYYNTEIDNCEFYGWSHAAISLISDYNHHIHHNYIHHCQYRGLGYGVSLRNAKSLIECNLFDYNRHSIQGSGVRECEYVACNNIELGTSYSHCFDMHGDRYRPKVNGLYPAGKKVIIHNNTFAVANKYSIRIRGVPEEKSKVFQNWFQSRNDGKAVRELGNVSVTANAYQCEK